MTIPRRLSIRLLLLAGLELALPTAQATAQAAAQDPSAAPPPEELRRKSEQWRQRKRRGAFIFIGSLGIAVLVIGAVRGRSRARRRALEREASSGN